MSAMFAPVFNILKARIKVLLWDRFCYTDGLTPEDINKNLMQFPNTKWFYENDLE